MIIFLFSVLTGILFLFFTETWVEFHYTKGNAIDFLADIFLITFYFLSDDVYYCQTTVPSCSH